MGEIETLRLPQNAAKMAVGSGFAFMPTNVEEAMRFSAMIAQSDLVPNDYKGKPGNVLIAIQMGAEVGLAPMQAIQGIAVINGRPSVWGDAALALVRAHPSIISITETVEGQGDSAFATCVVTRVKSGNTEVTTRSFSWPDAKNAGLAGKRGPWNDYPLRMLQMRARGFALRDSAADILKGLAIAEEAMDIPTVDAQPAVAGATRAEQVHAALAAAAPRAVVEQQDAVNDQVAMVEAEAVVAEELPQIDEARDFLDATADLEDETWAQEIGALAKTRGITNRDDLRVVCEKATGRPLIRRQEADAIVRALFAMPKVSAAE